MSHKIKIESTDEAWDTGELGRDEKHVRRSTPEQEALLDSALCLQPISVRLQKELIEQLKFIAKHHGIGYQPLMRDVLARWARTEMLAIAEQMKQQLEAKETIEAAARKRA
jgi:predicted DNA binding CopG/RHH family protein